MRLRGCPASRCVIGLVSYPPLFSPKRFFLDFYQSRGARSTSREEHHAPPSSRHGRSSSGAETRLHARLRGRPGARGCRGLRGCPKNASGVVPLTEVVCDRGHRGSRAIARPFKPPACVTVRLPGPAEPIGLPRRDDPRSHGPSDCNSPVSYGFERQYPRTWDSDFGKIPLPAPIPIPGTREACR